MKESDFLTEADSRIAAVSGRVGMAFLGIDDGLCCHINAREEFSAASTAKIFILGALLEKASHNVISLDEILTITARDHVPGSGILQLLSPGIGLPVRDLARLMIIASDNTATNLLLEYIGGVSAVNDHLARLGIGGAVLNRKIQHGAEEAEPRSHFSDASPAALTEYLKAVAEGIAFDDAGTAFFLQTMREQKYKDMFGRYLPLEDYADQWKTKLCNKTGFDEGTRADTGILELPDGRRYAYAVIVNDCSDHRYSPDNEAALFIADIGRLFYQFVTDCQETMMISALP